MGEDEKEYVMSALAKGDISGTAGGYIDEFERRFSHYSDCKYGVAVSSGTTSLHLAMATLGIGNGDEVIVPSFTNMATFFAVLYQGSKPIPIDIDPDTWNINPDLIEAKINRSTKAIIVVHIYGHPVDMDPVIEIASKHKLRIVEDCAEAHGALYNGKKVGSLGDIGCFSFYANKIITTGEGGMITTKDREMADKARSLRSLAFGDANRFMHKDIGFNYRMTNIQAALGCAQLKKIERIIDMKREVARNYKQCLEDIPGLQLPAERPYARNVYWMYHCVIHSNEFGSSRDRVREKLASFGVETREAFTPYNMQEIFIRRGWVKGDECPVANFVGRNGFYLPSSPLLKKDQVEYIADLLRQAHIEGS